MDEMQLPTELMDRVKGIAVDMSEAPRSIGRTAEYRGKVYRALLNQETARASVSPSKSKFPLFRKP
jgi:hypothetical protein